MDEETYGHDKIDDILEKLDPDIRFQLGLHLIQAFFGTVHIYPGEGEKLEAAFFIVDDEELSEALSEFLDEWDEKKKAL